MPSLIANCLARLVKEGRISQTAANNAQALHDGMQGRLGEEMGPASADAVAALDAARVMGEQARLRKASIAKQAIAHQNALERMKAHPRGTVAGLSGMLTRDLFEHGGINIDSQTEVIFGKLEAKFGPGNEALGSRFAGLRQDKELARTVIRENFGEDTGNASAKQISKGWKEATDYAANRAKAGGKMFAMAEDWRQPQFWESGRVKRVGEDEFTADIANEMKGGGLRVFDKETHGPATAMKIPAIVKTAYEDITTGGGRGHGVGLAFTPEMRVFRFAEGKAGADAYLRLMEKYGPGTDLYAMMRGHLHAASREIAFVEQFGPEYRANFRSLLDVAAKDQKAGRAKTIPIFSSPYGIEKTFRVLTGDSNAVASEVLAGVMGAGRAWLSAVQLGSATLSAIPGDSATLALSSGFNGIPAGRVIARTLNILAADSPTKRADAARLGIISYAAADTALTQARFADEWLDPRFAGKVANSVIRASGLQAWTEAAKRASTMEMLGWVADQTSLAYKNVAPGFRAFLDRYGFTPKEWDALRAAPLLEFDGARFFDADGIADKALGEKLLGAIIDERHFFVLEPTAMERAALAPAALKGTLTGELARSFGMYKTFAVTMVTTHMMRAAMRDNLGSKVGYSLALAGLSTMFGALAIGAKDIARGKDPRQMNTASFWGAALIQGGGLGILGDLIYQGVTRADTSLAGTLAGPLGAAVDAGSTLIFPTVRNMIAGDEVKFGAALSRQMRTYLSPVPFYGKLAVDRMFWDQIQTLIDPQYRKSFRRQEQAAKKNFAQSFWWRPGDATPNRTPNLGNVIQ